MATELNINLPDSLLEEARQAAEAAKTTLEEFVSQAISTQVQQHKPKTIAVPADWPKERMTQDRIWIDTHYQTLAENYPNQWVYIHGQRVCGAHRDMGKAEDQAEQVLGDIQRACPLAIFVATRYVI
jgi:enamine deaminase RidA (YjgF/YER057c/UK114 family)